MTLSPTIDKLIPPTTLREKIAQLLVIRIGSNLPPITRVHEDESRVAEMLAACPVGGLLLFNGVWPATRETLDRLQKQMVAVGSPRLLVASDIERGAGQQVAGLTVFPHQRAMVDLEDSSNAIQGFCQTTAREALAAGIHATYGPVADVNSDPRNPIIATRAFGDDPARAAELVAAYVRASENAGLMTTAKHFPGHGDTHQDSHEAMPRVEVSAETLRERELVPFKAAIDAGVSMLMTAHVEYPALDSSGAPATLSKPILVDLLRDEMGFQGVVCSDSLLMAGVRDRFDSEGELALATLLAGVDMLLDVADPVAVVEALTKAVETDRLSETRVNEAFNRIWRLKEKAFAQSQHDSPTSDELSQSEKESLRIASVATRVVSTASPSPLPLDRSQTVTALVLKPHHRPTDPPEQPLAKALRNEFAAVRYFETGPEVPTDLADNVVAGSPEGAPIVVAMIVKPAAWHAFGLNESQDALIHQLTKQRPIVLACLGVENALDEYDQAAARLVTHSDVAVSQQALAKAL